MLPILLVILVIVLIASLPAWGYSSHWGYRPSGIIALILIVLFIWFLVSLKEVKVKSSNGKTKIQIECNQRY